MPAVRKRSVVVAGHKTSVSLEQPFWDELAQFDRKAYLRWIDATKRSRALRAERIAAVVALLERGVKERP